MLATETDASTSYTPWLSRLVSIRWSGADKKIAAPVYNKKVEKDCFSAMETLPKGLLSTALMYV